MEVENSAMDRIPQSDLNRMSLSIEQEVRTKLKEMRIQTVQMYNKLKNERIESESRAVEREMEERKKKMAEYLAMSEGSMRNASKKKVQAAKSSKLVQIMHAVEERVRGRSLATVLIDECVRQVGEESLSQFLIYTLPRDHPTVRGHMLGNYSAQLARPTGGKERDINALLSDMLRVLPEDGLGGVIFFSRDGNVVCDNCFRTRLEIFRERHLKVIHQELFR